MQAREGLTWIEEPGVGYYPVDVRAMPYDAAYLAKYEGYAATPLGRALNDFRKAFVAKHWIDGPLVDVGIGCGQFVASRPRTWGYDVNPAGVKWLRDRFLWCDPYESRVEAASFWDSLEHISNPAPLLANLMEWAFVSIPIFDDLAHVLRSKHYRTDEHFWYFRERAFVAFMEAHGWTCVDVDDTETKLGRDGILSFAFRRHGGQSYEPISKTA